MNAPPSIELRVLDERVRTWGLPRYQTAMAAGVDLHACLDATLLLAPQAPAVLVRAGIAVHIADPNIAAFIFPRSGLGHRQGLVLGNSTGIVDADYTGEIMISCWNRSGSGTEPVAIEPGDRIAQLVFVPIVRPEIALVESFSQTSVRAHGGFGSTGD